MKQKNRRAINLVLESHNEALQGKVFTGDLDKLARIIKIPIVSTSNSLLKRNIENKEDRVWKKIVNERKKTKGKFFTHEKAWG